MAGSLLLLDLDGVVVFEAEPPLVAARELILLHENLGNILGLLGIPVVVLTHRSRREAHQILKAAALGASAIAGVIAAEDLLIAGIRHAPTRMIRKGLRKDLVLPVLERRFGVDRSCTAFVDDRLDNLNDLRLAGLGLAIHGPSGLAADRNHLITFAFGEVLSAVKNWDLGTHRPAIVSLAPRELALTPWCRTGLSTRAHRRHPFNAARHIGRVTRQLFSRPNR